MAASAGSVIFDIGISRASLKEAVQQVQLSFDRSGIGINNLSFTPQALANIKGQVDRAIKGVKVSPNPSITFDVSISKASLKEAIQQVQLSFDRTGVSIAGLSFTPQALANVKGQVDRAFKNVKIAATPVVGSGGSAPPQSKPAAGGSAPAKPTSTPPANKDILISLQAQRAAAESLLATNNEQAAALARQAANLNEALRFKRQMAQIKNAGLSAEDTKRAEQFARQVSQLNRQKIRIKAEIDGAPAISGANRFGSVLTGILQGVGQQITQILTQAFTAGIQAISQFTKASLDAAQSTRAINASLATSLGSAQEAARSYQFAKQTLDALGASVEQGTRQYASLTAAAQSAGIQQQLSDKFFASFAQTLAQNGVALEQQNRAFTAASQIFAKNTLSAEELRGQLAEALPSAIGVVARGLQDIGVSASGSTEELQKLLESGSISAEQFAQAWISGAGSVQGAIDPLNRSIGQATNKLFEFQQATGSLLAPLQQLSLDAFSAALDAVADSNAFAILQEGIDSFTKSFAASSDIADEVKLAIKTIAETGAGVFSALIKSIGQFIEALSPEQIQAYTRYVKNLYGGIADGITVVGNIATALVGLNQRFLEISNFLSNPPDWTGFFGVGLQVIGALINPLKTAFTLVNNIRQAIGGLEGVKTNPIGDIAGSAKKGIDATLNLVEQVASGTKKLDDSSAESAKQSARAREEANKKALESFERDVTNAERAIEQSQLESIARIKQKQADGQISATDADAQIKAIEANTDAAIAAKTKEIERIKSLESQGVITAKESADRIAQVKLEKTQLVISGLDAEIAAQEAAQKAAEEAAEKAKEAALEALDAQIGRAQELNQIREQELNIAASALERQQNLLDAQLDVTQLQSSLEQQRLNTALDVARAEGDVTGAKQAALALAAAQQQAISSEFEIKGRQLELTKEQSRIEAQRGIAAAEVAAIEARIALQKAEVNRAGAEELANLARLVELADQNVGRARDEAANVELINQSLDQKLALEQELEKAKAAQTEEVGKLAKAEEDLAARQKALAEEQINQAKKLADARTNAISSVFNAISQDASKTVEEGLAAIESAKKRLALAQQAGFFRDEEGRAATSATSAALREVQGLLGRGDQALTRAAFQATEDEDGGKAFADALRLAGRGDIASLIDTEAGFADIETAIRDSQVAIASKLDEVKQAIIDRDIAAAVTGGEISPAVLGASGELGTKSRIAALSQPAPPVNLTIESLSVSTQQPVADANKIMFEMAQQSLRGLG